VPARLVDRNPTLPDRPFGEATLTGGYRTKYRRAISRLVALTRLGAEVGNG
jgi:hypothetical protein